MIELDKPIENCKEDLLRRKRYGENLARVLLKYNRVDSLVLGLYSKWGSGKTSLNNMTLEKIHELSSVGFRAPIIIKYNPRNYSEQNQLNSMFF